MSEKSLILASGSESRRRLLAGAGLAAEAIKPNVDEDAAKRVFRADGLSVSDQAMQLAELKAMKVSRNKSGLVIGGDQMLEIEGDALDKPDGMDGARRHLERLSGKPHILQTAIVAAQGGEIVWRHMTRPKLFMRPLSPAFIEHYLEHAGEGILATVGAYQLEGLGAQLFEKIEGDYFSILGIPLLPLLQYLRLRGIVEA